MVLPLPSSKTDSFIFIHPFFPLFHCSYPHPFTLEQCGATRSEGSCRRRESRVIKPNSMDVTISTTHPLYISFQLPPNPHRTTPPAAILPGCIRTLERTNRWQVRSTRAGSHTRSQRSPSLSIKYVSLIVNTSRSPRNERLSRRRSSRML